MHRIVFEDSVKDCNSDYSLGEKLDAWRSEERDLIFTV